MFHYRATYRNDDHDGVERYYSEDWGKPFRTLDDVYQDLKAYEDEVKNHGWFLTDLDLWMIS